MQLNLPKYDVITFWGHVKEAMKFSPHGNPCSVILAILGADIPKSWRIRMSPYSHHLQYKAQHFRQTVLKHLEYLSKLQAWHYLWGIKFPRIITQRDARRFMARDVPTVNVLYETSQRFGTTNQTANKRQAKKAAGNKAGYFHFTQSL